MTWQTSKHEQGNPGTRPPGAPYDGTGHVIERNVLVTSELFRRPFEFELTRSMHMKALGTCSMAFKKAPQDQLLEAWRILRHASKNRTLFVDKVEQWHDSIRFKYGEQAQAGWEEPAPGSPVGFWSMLCHSRDYARHCKTCWKR